MLSELIKDFIATAQKLEEDINALNQLKEKIDITLDDESLQKRINAVPYLKSEEFSQKVASVLPLEDLADKLDPQKLEPICEKIIKEAYTPALIAQELVQDPNFKEVLKNRISLEARGAINATILTQEFKNALKEQIDTLTKAALKDNKIDKYRMQSAICLMIIRLHTKLIMIENMYEENFKFNLLKRI